MCSLTHNAPSKDADTNIAVAEVALSNVLVVNYYIIMHIDLRVKLSTKK